MSGPDPTKIATWPGGGSIGLPVKNTRSPGCGVSDVLLGGPLLLTCAGDRDPGAGVGGLYQP